MLKSTSCYGSAMSLSNFIGRRKNRAGKAEGRAAGTGATRLLVKATQQQPQGRATHLPQVEHSSRPRLHRPSYHCPLAPSA